MTKLEWCRTNAPDAIKNLPDDQLLELMEQAFNSIGIREIDQKNLESVEYELNEENNHLDYMVLTLLREFGTELAFKGGYLLTKLMPDCARQTTDVDFSIDSKDMYNFVKDSLINIAETLISKNVIDNYDLKETIEPTKSGGIKLRKDGSVVLGVDVGLHSTAYGTKEWKIDVGNIKGFEVERMLADKISAILSRKRFRRPKDLYDLYCISSNFEFNIKKVNEYILLRTNGLGADWQNYPFTDSIASEYYKCYNSLIVSSIYKNNIISKPTFNVVYNRFCNIAELLIKDVDVQWNPLLNS